MEKDFKYEFNYFDFDGYQCFRYDSDYNDINNRLIGKVQYKGESCPGNLTDGKTYDCIGLSYSHIRIIDDTGEPFYYDRNPSWKDKSAKLAGTEELYKLLVLNAYGNQRTPFESEMEKSHVIYVAELKLPDKNSKINHTSKQKRLLHTYVRKNQKLRESSKEQIDELWKNLWPAFKKWLGETQNQ
jgi:hypothetical protein